MEDTGVVIRVMGADIVTGVLAGPAGGPAELVLTTGGAGSTGSNTGVSPELDVATGLFVELGPIVARSVGYTAGSDWGVAVSRELCVRVSFSNFSGTESSD
jgi:hypothetical protein